jgi:hypothetical protein
VTGTPGRRGTLAAVSAVLPWVLRAAWAVLPVVAGPASEDALDGRSRTVQVVASLGLWGIWAAGVLATLVPRPAGLTLLRVAAPAACGAAVVALADDAGAASLTAVVATGVAAVLALLPETGELFVNGGAYGDERRHLLRPPAAFLLGPVPVAAAVLVAAVVTGPLLLAARSWVAGTVAVVVGAPLAVVLARALHSLTQRWVVFVPAGLVLKDHLGLLDPVLLRRHLVTSFGPAPAESDALDLTARAPGLALEVRLREPVPLAQVSPGRRGSETRSPDALRFTPTRPGAVLAEAERRRLVRA